jgi:hypothetical protein
MAIPAKKSPGEVPPMAIPAKKSPGEVPPMPFAVMGKAW